MNGSGPSPPASSAKECEKITRTASAKRKKSKLFRENAPASCQPCPFSSIPPCTPIAVTTFGNDGNAPCAAGGDHGRKSSVPSPHSGGAVAQPAPRRGRHRYPGATNQEYAHLCRP